MVNWIAKTILSREYSVCSMIREESIGASLRLERSILAGHQFCWCHWMTKLPLEKRMKNLSTMYADYQIPTIVAYGCWRLKSINDGTGGKESLTCSTQWVLAYPLSYQGSKTPQEWYSVSLIWNYLHMITAIRILQVRYILISKPCYQGPPNQ